MNSGTSTVSPAFSYIQRCLWQSSAFILIFQFVCNVSIPDHDADAFRTLLPPAVSCFDDGIRSFLSGLFRWDSQHFLHVAMYGYTYEHTIAFFPLFPMVTYAFSIIWYSIVPSWILSFPTALMISGIILNIVAFFGAAWSLFALTKNVVVSTDHSYSTNVALVTTLLFIFNPANIFFRAAYTESIYAFFTFLGLHCLLWKRSMPGASQRPGRNLLEAAVCFALALTTRSNGLLNLGYLFYYYGACWLRPLLTSRIGSTNSASRSGRIRSFTFRRHVKELLPTLPVFALALVSSLAPFLFAQHYQYQTFCSPTVAARVPVARNIAALAAQRHYVLPGDLKNLHWCRNESDSIWSLTSLPYTSVQSKYWQVGYFGYYSLRKLPLFILASPAFIVAICACVYHLTEMRLSKSDWLSNMINPTGALPFIVHVVFLTMVAGVFINVEVFTRMLLSSSPLPYWYCATFFLEKKTSGSDNGSPGQKPRTGGLDMNAGMFGTVKQLWQRASTGGKIILIWYLSYVVIGTVLFANFLPWT